MVEAAATVSQEAASKGKEVEGSLGRRLGSCSQPLRLVVGGPTRDSLEKMFERQMACADLDTMVPNIAKKSEKESLF